MGLLGLSGEEEGRLGQAAPPPPLVRIGQGRGGRPPFSFPLSPPSFPPTPPLGRGGILLPVGVGLPLGRA